MSNLPFDYGIQDNANSTSTLLTAGNAFTGATTANKRFSHIFVQVATDQPGNYQIQISNDGGANWDTTLTYDYDPDAINLPQPIFIGPRTYRVVFNNTSASAQTYLRLATYNCVATNLTTPINATIGQNFPASLVRTTDYESEVAMGKRQGRTVWNKFGFNLDVDVGTEIVASWGGAFDPTTDIMTSAQTFTIAYDTTTGGGDGLGTTGATQLLLYYIDGNFEAQTAVHVLSNTGSDVTAFTGVGINRVIVLANGGAGWNINAITVTATTDTTTQAQIPALGSVTQQCIFHTQINHTFLADYLRFKILKPSGGGGGNGFLIGYSWSRVTNTRYEVFRESYATSTTDDEIIELTPSQKFVIGGREVLYFVLEDASGANTYISGRFSGVEERNTLG